MKSAKIGIDYRETTCFDIAEDKSTRSEGKIDGTVIW